MRVLAISNTAVDLAAEAAPFLPGYTVVIANPTAGSLVVQSSASSGSGYATLATIGAGAYAEVTFDEQYVKVSTAATVYALGN